MKFKSGAVLIVLTFSLAACHQAESQQDDGKLIPITDHGRLLSVDQVLGTGTLDIDGKTVNFWWQNRVQRAATIAGPGSSLETQQIDVPFKANIGDIIYFRGFKSRGEIFITAATAVKP